MKDINPEWDFAWGVSQQLIVDMFFVLEISLLLGGIFPRSSPKVLLRNCWKRFRLPSDSSRANTPHLVGCKPASWDGIDVDSHAITTWDVFKTLLKWCWCSLPSSTGACLISESSTVSRNNVYFFWIPWKFWQSTSSRALAPDPQSTAISLLRCFENTGIEMAAKSTVCRSIKCSEFPFASKKTDSEDWQPCESPSSCFLNCFGPMKTQFLR